MGGTFPNPLPYMVVLWVRHTAKRTEDKKTRGQHMACLKMSTFGIHRLDWLMVGKMFSWNANYETIYGWFASFIVTYTIMELKS
jgi:hypothetical protein